MPSISLSPLCTPNQQNKQRQRQRPDDSTGPSHFNFTLSVPYQHSISAVYQCTLSVTYPYSPCDCDVLDDDKKEEQKASHHELGQEQQNDGDPHRRQVHDGSTAPGLMPHAPDLRRGSREKARAAQGQDVADGDVHDDGDGIARDEGPESEEGTETEDVAADHAGGATQHAFAQAELGHHGGEGFEASEDGVVGVVGGAVVAVRWKAVLMALLVFVDSVVHAIVSVLTCGWHEPSVVDAEVVAEHVHC